MKINVVNANDFKPNRTQKFFLDSNVWMYLFFPQHSSIANRIIDKYSHFFNSIVKSDCLIETNILQISELVNLILHLEFKEARKRNVFTGSFKEFRNSNFAISALTNAKVLTDKIIKCSTLRDGIFGVNALQVIVASCDKADFNDLFFAEFCKNENAILVTHDFDFKAVQKEIQVVSFNSNYYE